MIGVKSVIFERNFPLILRERLVIMQEGDRLTVRQDAGDREADVTQAKALELLLRGCVRVDGLESERDE